MARVVATWNISRPHARNENRLVGGVNDRSVAACHVSSPSHLARRLLADGSCPLCRASRVMFGSVMGFTQASVGRRAGKSTVFIVFLVALTAVMSSCASDP